MGMKPRQPTKREAAAQQIEAEHVSLAAMYFAITNLGQPDPKGLPYIQDDYARLNAAMQMETGYTITEEYLDWHRLCRKQDPYCVKEWHKFLDSQASS